MKPLFYWCSFLVIATAGHGLLYNEVKHIMDEVKACGLDGVCNCTGDLKMVDCSGRNLTNVPIGIPYNTSILFLSNNQIETVPTTWMLQFDNLIKLDISSNRISDPFALPTSLYYLDISNNDIKESFKLPPHLINLNAASNNFNSFEEFFQEGCSDLRNINVRSNNVSEISDGLFKDCSKLRELELRDNPLQFLTNGTLKGLTAVRILGVPYPSGHVEVGAFRDACKNLLTLLLGDSFPSVRALTVGIFEECNKLQELYILGIGVSEILDGTFIGCSRVTFLSLTANRFIASLPEGLFDGFICIADLNLSRLNLTTIPENLFHTTGCISRINLGYNRIQELPDNLFSKARHNTYQMFLYYNELSYISKAFFRNLPNLQEIYLNSNNLQHIDDRMFLGTHLQIIYLFQNNITRLQGRPFFTGNESTVRLLQISDNPLGYVSSEAMMDLVPNANITMSCGNTTLPSNVKDINMLCVASSVPIVINEAAAGLPGVFESGGGGFTCTKGTCTSCKVGQYSDKIHSTCIGCPSGGFYQDRVGVVSKEFGGIACKKCNNGTFVEHGAGTSALSCDVCPEGTDKTRTAGFRACFCLKHFYRNNRFDKCFPCPSDGMNCSNDYVRIKPGYFWHWWANDSDDYKRYIINIQTENDSYDTAWSMYNGSIPRAYKCLEEKHCVNDILDIEGNCHKGYQGWMCTVCQEGYFKLFGWCHKCHLEFVLGIMLLFIVLVVFLWFGIINPLARNSQSTDRGSSGGDLIISRVKIMFGFYQVVDSYWHSMGTFLWFTSVQVVISRIIEVMSFTLSSIFVSPSCYISWFKWNPYTKLWTLYVTLLLIASSLAVGYFIACILLKLRVIGSSLVNTKTTCLKLFTFTMFASYTETCDVVFQLYNCDEFPKYEYNETAKVNLLHSHYNISCETDRYLRYRRVFALPGWIFICTFPLITWALLYKYSRSNLDHDTLAERQYPEWLSFMCDNYKSRCWYWEILELGRKVLLTFLPLAFGWEGIFIIIGLSASSLFLAVHAFVRPMKDSWDNALQFMSLLFLNFNMIVSAIHSSDNTEPVMYLIVSLMNVTIFAILTGEALWRIFMLVKASSLCNFIRCEKSTNDELKGLLSTGSDRPSDDATLIVEYLP